MKTPAQILMSHGGSQHHTNPRDSHRAAFATGGHTVPIEGAARANAHGGPMAPMARDLSASRAYSEGGKMRRGGRRHHAEGERAASEGGKMRCGGRRHAEGGKMKSGGHHHGVLVNPKTGKPQYFAFLAPLAAGLAGSLIPGLFKSSGGRMSAGGHYAEGERAASEGGKMRRGGRRHHAEGERAASEGGKMRRGGRRHYNEGGRDYE